MRVVRREPQTSPPRSRHPGARRGRPSGPTRCWSSASSSGSRHVEVQVDGRCPRRGAPPRRARVLDPAAASEGGRGDAEPGAAPAAAPGAVRRPEWPPRAPPPTSARHGRVPDGARRPLLLPRDEHAAPGRAPGDGSRHRARPRAPAARSGGRSRAAAGAGSRSSAAATRSSAGSTPRTRQRDDLPSPGRVLHLCEPEGPGIRVDSGLQAGSEVSVHYDPLLSKIVAWGRDRGEATARMREALRQHGGARRRDEPGAAARDRRTPGLRGGRAAHRLHRGAPAGARAAAPARPPLAIAALAAALRLGKNGGPRGRRRTPDPWASLGPWRLGEGA